MVYNQNKDETGHDGALIINGEEIAITNASYDGPDPDWSEVQFNDALHQDIALTGVSYGGSFEFAGSSEALRNELIVEANDGKYNVPANPQSVELHIEEETENGIRTVIFRDVGVGTRSRDIPSDDRATTSYDFIAERMYKK
jgi:hypothetical protein